MTMIGLHQVTFKVDINKIRADGILPVSTERALGPWQQLGEGDVVTAIDYDGETFLGYVHHVANNFVYLVVEVDQPTYEVHTDIVGVRTSTTANAPTAVGVEFSGVS